jgi:hypothetical protein
MILKRETGATSAEIKKLEQSLSELIVYLEI